MILFLFYAISIVGFIKSMSGALIDYDPNFLALIVSAIGIGLGFIFYGISFFKKSIKIWIFNSIPGFILLAILIIYSSSGLSALYDFLIALVKFGFFMLMFAMPIIGVYALLKERRYPLIMSCVGALFFYFFILIISRVTRNIYVPFYSADEIAYLMFYFTLAVLYLELGFASINFNNIVKKISPNENLDDFILSRFNRVFNRYLIQVPVLILVVYAVSLLFFWRADIFNTNDFFGIKLTSSLGIFILVLITIASAFVFWYLIPREKKKEV